MIIEVEKRGTLERAQWEQLHDVILSLGGEDMGPNDTRTDFYLAKGSQVKVQHALSKKTAKMAWKSGGNNGASAREEIEVHIPVQDLSAARLLMCKLLPDAQHFATRQERHDYRIGEVNIAVKRSDGWGYHVELEVLVRNKEDILSAEKAIKDVAERLNIKMLSQKEEKAFVEKKIAEQETR